MPLKADISPEEITAVIDRREQDPLDLSPLQMEPGTLPTGDYTLLGLEHVVAVERKSLPDLLACIGRERGRFDREVRRLLAYPVRALVVEASWSDLEAGEWRHQLTPSAVQGSLLGWMAAGLPVLLAGDREAAGRFVSRLLYIAARRRWREVRQLLPAVLGKLPTAGAATR